MDCSFEIYETDSRDGPSGVRTTISGIPSTINNLPGIYRADSGNPTDADDMDHEYRVEHRYSTDHNYGVSPLLLTHRCQT